MDHILGTTLQILVILLVMHLDINILHYKLINGWCSCDNNFEHATRDGPADGITPCNGNGSLTCSYYGGDWCNYIYQIIS